jgi:hypothetical protein
MNTLVKTGVAAALALGATGAFALGVPSTGSSDLVLVVQNTATPTNVYLLDTGINLNTIFPTGSLVSGASLSTAIAGINDAIDASPALTSFLATNPASGDAWELVGGAFNINGPGNAAPVNSNTKTAGNAKGVFTSLQPSLNISGLGLSGFQTYLGEINNDIGSGGGMAVLQTTTESTAGSFSVTNDGSKGIFPGAYDLASLGSSQSIYALTGNNGTGTPQSYILGSATLDTSGNLTITGNAPAVPLPAAVWLFGSGVLGLVGVSRRRKAAAATGAG